MAKHTFTNIIPLEDDGPAIADIHLRAMHENLLTHAQFPNPQALDYFRGWIVRNTVRHIGDADKGVLMARDVKGGEAVSFVKWLEYGTGGEELHVAAEDEWPEYCGRDILDEYAAVAAEARRRIMGGKSGYFHVTFICTDPVWARRGAATALLAELKDLAAAAGKPIILEAVMPAVPFYKRLGFETRQQLQLLLPPRGSKDRTEVYLEEMMVWTPPLLEEAK